MMSPETKAGMPSAMQQVLLLLAGLLVLLHSSCRHRETPTVNYSLLPDLSDKAGLSGIFCGLSGEYLIVAGGTNFPEKGVFEGGNKVWHSTVYALHMHTMEWHRAGRLPAAIADGASVTTENGIVLIGGSLNKQQFSDVVLRISIGQEGLVLDTLPSLPYPLAYHCAALVGNTIFLSGGQPTPNTVFPRPVFWSLDLTENQAPYWKELDPPPGAARTHAIAAAHENSFFLLGGRTNVPDGDSYLRTYLSDCYRFSCTDGWDTIASMPYGLSNAPSPAGIMHGQNRIVVLGGVTGRFSREEALQLQNEHPGFDQRIIVYDIDSDSWSEPARFPKKDGPDPVSQPGEAVWLPINTATLTSGDCFVIPCGEIRPGTRTPKVLSIQVEL